MAELTLLADRRARLIGVGATSDEHDRRRLLRALGRMDRHGPTDPIAEIAVFAGVTDLADVEARLRDEVRREVEAMLALTEEFDAFDVIDLMRQRELPISPVLALQPDFDGSGAAVELVALLMLSRGMRKPSPTPREDTRPNEAIDELHRRSKRLLRLAVYRAKACEFCVAAHRSLGCLLTTSRISSVSVRSSTSRCEPNMNEHFSGAPRSTGCFEDISASPTTSSWPCETRSKAPTATL